MTAGLSVRPTPAACRISTASPILFHPSLITVFRVVPTLVSHENGSQYTRVSSLAGMEVEPSTWYSSRDTHPSIDPAHWRLTSQPCLCSNHHSTWAHCRLSTRGVFLYSFTNMYWLWQTSAPPMDSSWTEYVEISEESRIPKTWLNYFSCFISKMI